MSIAPIKVGDVRTVRTLASDITNTGAKVFDLMEYEMTERTERARAIRFLDQVASGNDQYVERSLREIIEVTKQTVEDSRYVCAAVHVWL